MKSKSMRYTNGKPRTATATDCQGNWSGGTKGENFRCYFCGVRFKPGDYWRWQYTNDLPGGYGNPLVCGECDEGTAFTRIKWMKKCAEFYSDKWWWFGKL